MAKKAKGDRVWTAAEIKSLRERLGLTPTEAARWLRVSMQLWSNWETEYRTPTKPMHLLLTLLDQGKLPPPPSPDSKS